MSPQITESVRRHELTAVLFAEGLDMIGSCTARIGSTAELLLGQLPPVPIVVVLQMCLERLITEYTPSIVLTSTDTAYFRALFSLH